MKKKQSMILGILLIGFSVFIAFLGYQRVKEVKSEENKTPSKKVQEAQQQEIQKEITVLFEIKGLSDDEYQMLGVKEQDLASFLQEWTYYNGFSRARMASFYPEIVYNADEKIYYLECQLDDEDQTILAVRYEKQRKKWEAHL